MTGKQTNDSAVEFPVSSLTYADMVLGTTRLEGMQLCEGCQDYFVLEGFCGSCARINADLEARRARMRQEWVDRAEMGTVPFEPSTAAEPPSLLAIGTLFLGVCCTVTLTMTVFWFGLRGLIGFCLQHSKP